MSTTVNRPKIDRTIRMGDHEMIYPANELRLRALVRTDGRQADENAIERAGSALTALSADFDEWMNDEVEKLVRAHKIYAASSADPLVQVDLFRQAHDLKGNAGMLGYPLVGEAAHGLARLLESLPPQSVPIRLVENHVQSIRALASRAIYGPDNPVALELVSELRSQTNPVIESYLEKQRAGETTGR